MHAYAWLARLAHQNLPKHAFLNERLKKCGGRASAGPTPNEQGDTPPRTHAAPRGPPQTKCLDLPLKPYTLSLAHPF